MKIQSLQHVAVDSLAAAFNEAFSDYLIPIRVSAESLALKMRQEDILLEYSAGAFENGRLVGFILQGKRKFQSGYWLYNAGTGVLPAHRGQHLTERIYDHVIASLSGNIKGLVLEVLCANEKALHVYRKYGFGINRKLVSFSGEKPGQAGLGGAVHIRPLASVPDHVTDWWTDVPSWPGSTVSLNNISEALIIRGAYLKEELVGYIAALATTGRIFQLAVDPSLRRQGIGRSLIGACFHERNHATMQALNCSAQDAVLRSFFSTLGWKETISQFEMQKILRA